MLEPGLINYDEGAVSEDKPGDSHPGQLEKFEEFHYCNSCDKMFTRKSSLNRHRKSHDPGCIRCMTCNVFFDAAEDLAVHQQKVHPGPLPCPTCGKFFSRKSYLNFHIHKFHDDSYVGKYKCEIEGCSKVFDQMSAYQKHLNVHKGIRPYMCEKCGKSYTCKPHLRSHTRICVEDQKYECNKCNKQFLTRTALKGHRQAKHLNKVFPCSCGKVFQYVNGLLGHKKSQGH